MLGSVDSNTGSPDLGWDTDQFPMDIRNTTMVMKVKQNPIQYIFIGILYSTYIVRHTLCLNYITR